jgi:hypothetical protein
MPSVNNESDKEKEKLPQRMSAVLGTIGENAVLFQLFVIAMRYPHWNVYHNLADKGCDLILLNSINNNKIKIEVKTRQKLYSTSKNQKAAVQFTLTEGEYEACDFLIGYWFEKNLYYIVPKEKLYMAMNKRKRMYKYAAPFSTTENEFINKWEVMEDAMKLKGQ